MKSAIAFPAKFWLSKLSVGSLLLTGALYAQIASEPAASAMVSIKPDSNSAPGIEPGKPAAAPDSEAAIIADPMSLLPELPPVPRTNATLIGGTIEKLDRVRDKITVRVFGGGKVGVLFDPRTQVDRGGKTVSLAELREGDRIYLDTILDGTAVFARTIRLRESSAAGETQGVVMKFREGELTLRDAISPIPVRVRVTSSTKLTQGNKVVPVSMLVPGALVSVNFLSGGEDRNTAREISFLAQPGTRYIFAGQVLHIDLRSGLLVLNSTTDHKTYEVYLDPSVAPDDNLRPGATVTVAATFEDSRYVARSLTIDSQ